MTILFVTPFYYTKKRERPKGGGLNMYLCRVTAALKQLGHTPIIIALGTRNAYYTDNGVEIFYVRCQHIPIKPPSLELLCNMLYESFTMNRKIAKLIREKKIDIIQFASARGLAACYFDKTPAVMRLSIYTKVYRNYTDKKTETDITALTERFAAKRCNAVFGPSNVIAETFSQAIHRPVSVIETPFLNENKINDDTLYNEMLSGKKYFLHYGRLTADKGILVIADSLWAFFNSHPDYYFVCCGMIQGPIYGENPVNILRKAAGEYQNRFIFIDSLPHHLLYPIIQHADFVVFPALIDNFPNACIEAMYFERVVIGSDGASHEQLIDDKKSGLLCEPNNAKSFLKKMNEAAAMDTVQKAEMGRLAKKRIDKLAPEVIVKKLLRYYQYVIDNSKSKK